MFKIHVILNVNTKNVNLLSFLKAKSRENHKSPVKLDKSSSMKYAQSSSSSYHPFKPNTSSTPTADLGMRHMQHQLGMSHLSGSGSGANRLSNSSGMQQQLVQSPEKAKRHYNSEVDPARYRKVLEEGITKFACSLCGNTYKWRKSLNKHWKEKHITETPPPLDAPVTVKLRNGLYNNLYLFYLLIHVYNVDVYY